MKSMANYSGLALLGTVFGADGLAADWKRERLEHVTGVFVLDERHNAQIGGFPAPVESETMGECRFSSGAHRERARKRPHDEVVTQFFSAVLSRGNCAREIVFV
jgi:hypothetical protein